MKRILPLLLAMLCLCLPALSESRVIDEAGLLDSGEEATLAEQIADIADTYQFDVAIVLKNSIGGKEVKLYAADLFEEKGFGYGVNGDGILFLLSMAERDYATVTHGSGIQAFTDYGLDRIHEDIVPLLSDGDYAQALNQYLRHVKRYLEQYQNGEAYDVNHTVTLASPFQRANGIFPVLLIAALVIALIVAFSLKAQMKTVRRKIGASSYVRDGSFHLTRSQDIYLYTTTHRRKIETNSGNNGGGGGSTTFHSSSGGSFGGRSGKF